MQYANFNTSITNIYMFLVLMYVVENDNGLSKANIHHTEYEWVWCVLTTYHVIMDYNGFQGVERK